MARRISDRERQKQAEAQLRQQALKRKTKAIGLNSSGPCQSQLVTLIPTLLQGKSEKSNKRIKRDKALGFGKAAAYGVRNGISDKEALNDKNFSGPTREVYHE